LNLFNKEDADLQSFFKSFISSLKEVLDQVNTTNCNKLILPTNSMAEDRSLVKNQTIVLNSNSTDNDKNTNLLDESIYSGCSFNTEKDQRFSNFYIYYQEDPISGKKFLKHFMKFLTNLDEVLFPKVPITMHLTPFFSRKKA
jgi:hypothetical protein